LLSPYSMTQSKYSMEPLIAYGEKPGEYLYLLATDITLASDKSYYDITLRRGVTFHDGTTFDAEAAKWNLDRVIAQASLGKLTKVTSIEVVDDYTLRLNLSSWDNRILNDLTTYYTLMISPTAFETNGADWASTHPVGTGPFIFKEVVNNQKMVWERNPNYWDAPLPYLDAITLDFIPDQATFIAAIKTGEIMGTDGTASPDSGLQLQSVPGVRVFTTNAETVQGLGFNDTDPSSIWYDIRMRQALEYAIDKDTLSKLNNYFYVPVYDIIKGIEEVTESQIVPRKYDPDKARELIKEAGYPNGVKFKLWINAGHWAGAGAPILAIQQMLAEVGMDMEITPVEDAKYNEMYFADCPVNDLITQFVSGSKDSPAEPVVTQLINDRISLIGMARPPEWPALLEKAITTTDIDEELSILAQMDKLAYDMVMYIPLITFASLNVLTDNVKDYSFGTGSSDSSYWIARAWISP